MLIFLKLDNHWISAIHHQFRRGVVKPAPAVICGTICNYIWALCHSLELITLITRYVDKAMTVCRQERVYCWVGWRLIFWPRNHCLMCCKVTFPRLQLSRAFTVLSHSLPFSQFDVMRQTVLEIIRKKLQRSFRRCICSWNFTRFQTLFSKRNTTAWLVRKVLK